MDDVFGHSDRELNRLQQQELLIDPFSPVVSSMPNKESGMLCGVVSPEVLVGIECW